MERAARPGFRYDTWELRERLGGTASDFSAVLRSQPGQWGVLEHELPIGRVLSGAGMASSNSTLAVLGNAWLWH